MAISSLTPKEKSSVWQTPRYLTYKPKTVVIVLQPTSTVYIQELGTYLYVMLVEDFPSILRLGRLRDGWCYGYSWQPGENPKSTDGKRNVECYIEKLVLFVAVTTQTTTPSLDTLSSAHSSAMGNDVPEKKGSKGERLQGR